MECDFRNTVACLLQFWNWLENKRGRDNKISRRVWKVVKTKTEKVRIAKAKREREKGRRRKETRREKREKKKKKKQKKIEQ